MDKRNRHTIFQLNLIRRLIDFQTRWQIPRRVKTMQNKKKMITSEILVNTATTATGCIPQPP